MRGLKKKGMINMKVFNKIGVMVFAIMFLTSVSVGALASRVVWEGQSYLQDAQTIIGELVNDVVELDNENNLLEQENDELSDEIEQANNDAITFYDNVCDALDDLPYGIRQRTEYTDICPLP